MSERKKEAGLKSILIVSAFILGIVLGAVFPFQRSETNTQLNGKIPSGLVVYPELRVNVYDKDGNLLRTYKKVGDLPTKNLLLYLLNSWWYGTGSIQLYNYTMVDESGTSRTPANGCYHSTYFATVSSINGISLKVALGSGTTTPTINDYALANKLAEAPVTYYTFSYNSTHMWIAVKATYTASSATSITEVGLFAYDEYGSSTYAWFMLFRDVIPQVNLASSNTLEVWYYIYIKYA